MSFLTAGLGPKRVLRLVSFLEALSPQGFVSLVERVSQIKTKNACPLCGCPWPETNHSVVERNLEIITGQRKAYKDEVTRLSAEIDRLNTPSSSVSGER